MVDISVCFLSDRWSVLPHEYENRPKDSSCEKLERARRQLLTSYDMDSTYFVPDAVGEDGTHRHNYFLKNNGPETFVSRQHNIIIVSADDDADY
jgi:hypothetical protein